MTSAEYRREMTGNMPTGSYDWSDMQFTITRREAPELQSWDRIVLELIEWPRDEI